MTMRRFRRYRHPAPAGAIVVRIMESGGEPFGFMREVQDPDEADAYPTEQQPIDHVWRLVASRLEETPDAPVFVEMEPGVEWNPAWGELTG